MVAQVSTGEVGNQINEDNTTVEAPTDLYDVEKGTASVSKPMPIEPLKVQDGIYNIDAGSSRENAYMQQGTAKKDIETSFETQQSNQSTVHASLHGSDPLCDRCKSINFNTIFSRQPPRGEFLWVKKLEFQPQSGCALCRFFAEYCGGKSWDDVMMFSFTLVERRRRHTVLILVPDDPKVGSFLSKVLAESLCISQQVFRSWDSGIKFSRPDNCRAFDPRAEIRNLSQAESPTDSSLPPTPIDFSIFKTWLVSCKKLHDQYCQPSKICSNWPIRLIDCDTRLVVKDSSLGNTSPQFAVLSYVWERQQDLQFRQPDYERPLEDLPLTILDSIFATQKLGLRYLWVDNIAFVKMTRKISVNRFHSWQRYTDQLK